MRLSGLTRSGERMAEFLANNQRHLFASIVLTRRSGIPTSARLPVFQSVEHEQRLLGARVLRCFGAYPLAQ